jgi:hypothetical protein
LLLHQVLFQQHQAVEVNDAAAELRERDVGGFLGRIDTVGQILHPLLGFQERHQAEKGTQLVYTRDASPFPPAFILGVVPLVIAHGAEMRRSLGTAVFSGMVGVTAFGVFLTPVFFYVIQRFGEGKKQSMTG